MISLAEHASGSPPAGLEEQVARFFSAEGPLAQARNFEFRPQQQAMAVAVAHALEHGEHLAVEAGTGVGKSLAYLVPSILFAVAKKKKAVISTHTINLQEQLIEKDLPLLARVMQVPFEFHMLKGRANYLCRRRLHKAMLQADGLFTSSEIEELKRIHEWSKTTVDGTLSDFDVEPDPRVWSQVCSERGLCAPKICGGPSDFAKEHGLCFFQRARLGILGAEVLVLNHTLFFTLLGGVGEDRGHGILFKNDFVVFDEAHTVEQVASKYVGLNLSSGQFRYSLNRLWNPRTQKGLFSAIRQGPGVKLVSDALEEGERFFGAIEAACDDLATQQRTPEARGDLARGERDRSRGWTELRIRRPELVPDTVTLSLQRLREAVSEAIKLSEDADTGQELLECNRRLIELQEQVAAFLDQGLENHVYWIERGGRTQQILTLSAAPIDVATFLRRRLFESETSVILTSATLGTVMGRADRRRADAGDPGGDSQAPDRRLKVGTAEELPLRRSNGALDYFTRRVGAEAARQVQVGSPFDFERQMRVYVAHKMPDPRESGFKDALQDRIEHFVRQTHGKAFVLFTNTRLMHEMGDRLAAFFASLNIRCFVQGRGMPRATMLENFKNDVDSVLFGTDSFWQGVDVPGEALSNVIITRLPFAVPDHPLIEARVEAIEARGSNAFGEFTLPEAILKFRQGVGRLIRAKTDRGIVVVLDSRILTKRYGQAFLDAIPKCPVEVV